VIDSQKYSEASIIKRSAIIASDGVRGKQVVEDLHHRILGQYDQKVTLFQELTGKVHALVEEMLQQQLIEVHSVTSRVEERNSLRTKLDNPEKNYSDEGCAHPYSRLPVAQYKAVLYSSPAAFKLEQP
jgi:hypothetical protein